MIAGSSSSYSKTPDGRHVYTDPQGQGWVTSGSNWVWWNEVPEILGPVETTLHTFRVPPIIRDERESLLYYGPGKWVFIPEGYEISVTPKGKESKE
jgi:hypothetical protein